MPCWWTPDWWRKALAPTMALLGCTTIPVRSDTRRLALWSWVVSTLVLRPKRSWRVLMPITTSSSEALPARSPMPLMVHSTWRAPAWTAARRVGHRQAQVVVAVDGDDRLVDVGHVLLDAADERLELVGDGVAYGIGDVNGCGAGRDALLEQRVDVERVGAGRVHGRELDVGAVLLGPRHGRAGHLPHLVAVLLQLVHHVDVGGGEEDVDAGLGGVFHRLPAGVHVARAPPAPGRR